MKGFIFCYREAAREIEAISSSPQTETAVDAQCLGKQFPAIEIVDREHDAL